MRNFLHLTSKCFRNLFVAVAVFSWCVNEVVAQCALSTFNEGGAITPTACQQQVNVGSGTYVNVTLRNSGIYYFDHCSSSNWSDDQLTGYQGGSSVLFYNDDNGPLCAGTHSSYMYAPPGGGTIQVMSNRFNCQGWVGSGAGNSGVLTYRCSGPGTPTTFGNGQWLLYGYNAGNATGGAGAWTNCYSGFMTVAPESFSTASLWTSSGSPSDNTSFLGCTIGGDNHSWSAKRTGFTCGVYQITAQIPSGTAQVIINSGTPINVPAGGAVTVYTGVLNNASTIDFRASVGTGASEAQITITNISTPLSAGTIDANQTICSGGDPAPFTNTTSPSGGAGSSYTNGSYTYNWIYADNCSGTPVILGVNSPTYDPPAGLLNTRCYVRRVTDACGVNAATSPVTVTVSPSPTITSINTNNALCNGSSTGSIQVLNVSQGNPPFQYSLNGGAYQSSTLFSGLTAGSYFLAVRDTIGCSSNYTGNPINISQPTAITHTATKTDASCAGVYDGELTISASGGVPPLSYSLNGGPTQPGSFFGGLSAGTYLISVFDNNGCSDTSSITIDNTYVTSVTVDSQSNVSCYGAGDGSLSVHVNGGVPPYSYSLNGVTYQPLGTFTGLNAGTYTVIGRDSRGCLETATVTIAQPAQLSVRIDSVVNVLCYGDSTGNVNITPLGGTAPYSYLWSNGTTNQNNTGLAAGVVNVTVTDTKGCVASAGATVLQPLELFLNIASYNDLFCYGDSSGAIDITANGGVPAYDFAWSNTATTEDLVNLKTGNYSVTVTDANGCSVTTSQTINEPTEIMSSVTGTSVTCNGANDGSADLTVSGGTAPYFYLWSNFNATQDLSGVSGGLYTVIITDHNGCEKRDSILIAEPTALVLTSNSSNITCFNANDGSIDLTVMGGSPTYTFLWNDGATTEDRTALAGGTYMVTVTDDNGCTATVSVTIVNPLSITTNYILTAPLCYSDSNGAINLIASGGTPAFTYSWNNGVTTEDQSGIPAGTYIVTITDSRGCAKTDSVTLTEPNPMNVTENLDNITSNGDNDGAITLTVYGGTLPYDYNWSTSPPSTRKDLTGLSAGTYSVTVTDANGCDSRLSYNIFEPQPLTTTISGTNPLCNGVNTGSVVVTPSGGTVPYEYLWSNFDTDSAQAGVPAGRYVVLVTDANGCHKYDSITLTGQSIPLYTTTSVSNPTCFDGSNGFISVVVTGGTIPYSYAWSEPSSQGATATNLSAGTYTLTVTDASNCSVTVSSQLSNPTPITVVTNPTPARCYNTATGIVTATVTGGNPPYVYQLNGIIQASNVFSGLHPGNHIISVRDVNGCEGTSSFTITAASELSVDLQSPQNVILQGMSTQLIATANNPVVNYFWSPLTDTAGNPLFSFVNCNDPDNCHNPSVSPIFTTVFTVSAMNADSCFAYDTVTVYVEVQPSAFLPSAFTPNDDNLNDRFDFDILGAVSAEVSIFNRWGERVYYNPSQKNGINTGEGWDGKKDGILLPYDTYVYQLKVTYADGIDSQGLLKDRTGTITLLR